MNELEKLLETNEWPVPPGFKNITKPIITDQVLEPKVKDYSDVRIITIGWAIPDPDAFYDDPMSDIYLGEFLDTIDSILRISLINEFGMYNLHEDWITIWYSGDIPTNIVCLQRTDNNFKIIISQQV